MAIVFNGTTNLLSWAGTLRGALPITIFCWAKRTITGAEETVFQTASSTGSLGAQVRSFQTADGIYRETTGFSTSAVLGNSSEYGWNPLMVVVQGASVQMYHGASNATPTSEAHVLADTLSLHDEFVIGGTAIGTAAPTFRGEICEVAVWNTALGNTEWATLKACIAPEGVSAGSLVEAWFLRELGAYTGVNGRTLSLTGTVTRSSTDPFTRVAVSLSGNATLDDVSASGSIVLMPAGLSGSAALGDITASGSLAFGIGTITTPVLKNNTGTILTSVTGIVANVYHPTTGVLIVRKTGLTSNGSGIVVITDGLISAGTTYAYEIDLSATSQGRRLPIGAAA